MPAANTMTFTPVGDFGVEVAEHEGFLHIRTPLDVTGARLSQSGKTKVLSSTGGWVNIPGSAVRINLNTGVKAG